MSVKQPATPLPWRQGDAGQSIFGPPNGTPSPRSVALSIKRADATYIVHSANAYAKLVEALRACVLTGGALQIAEGAAVLRNLGEKL